MFLNTKQIDLFATFIRTYMATHTNQCNQMHNPAAHVHWVISAEMTNSSPLLICSVGETVT